MHPAYCPKEMHACMPAGDRNDGALSRHNSTPNFCKHLEHINYMIGALGWLSALEYLSRQSVVRFVGGEVVPLADRFLVGFAPPI